MSLLLDALNRASKDKASAAHAPAPTPAPVTVNEESALSLLPNPTPETDWPTLAPLLPTIELSTVELPTVAAPPQPPPAAFRSAPPPMEAMMELVALPQAEPPPPPASFPPPEPPPAPLVVEPPSAPTPTPAPVPPVIPKPRPSAPVDATRAAQNLVRAKTASAKPAFPTRMVALISVAVLLASGGASVLLGWWGDPMAWLPASPSLTPAQPPVTQPDVSAAQPVPEVAAAPPESAAPTRVSASSVASTTPLVASVKARTPRPVAASPTATPCPPGQAEAECQTLKKPAAVADVAPPKAVPAKSSPPLLESRRTGPSPLELGYAALTQGRAAEAAQAYAQALRANPEERDALLGLAYLAQQQGRKEEARNYYQRVLRQDPSNPQAKAGLLLLSPTEDLQALGSQSRENAEQNPNSAAAQSVWGHSLVRQGRLAEAQLAFERAHTLEPTVALHAFNLAVALDRLRNYGLARRYYEEALTLSTRAGGERANGVPHAVVQRRLEQLQEADL